MVASNSKVYQYSGGNVLSCLVYLFPDFMGKGGVNFFILRDEKILPVKITLIIYFK